MRIEEDKLVVTPTEAEEESPAIIRLREEIAKRLPRIDLPDLLIEINSWVNYLDYLHHLAGQKPDSIEAPTYLFAAILAEATNLGYTAMADSSSLAYARLVWYSNWLASCWGDGKFSSSDGQRFVVPVKALNSRYLPKYYGPHRGLTFYSWTSNQHTQYGSKPIPTTGGKPLMYWMAF